MLEIEKLDRSEAFRYMGFKGGEIKESILKITEECEKELLKAIKPRLVYRVFEIEKTDEGIGMKNTSVIFRGKDIAAHLECCDRCVLMCVTLSADADRLIRQYEAGNMEKAVIADSLASAAVEQACEMAEKEIQNTLGSYNYTWRFSPGYGDFPLEIQKEFLDIIDAPKRIGVNITDSLILIPKKSVTAVIGISEKEISKGRRGCGCCNMKESCQYRKRGEHCGI